MKTGEAMKSSSELREDEEGRINPEFGHGTRICRS